MNVFISCAEIKQDLEIAEKLYDDLKHEGISPWMEDRDLKAGENKGFIIESKIRECKAHEMRKTSKKPWFKHAAYRAIDHSLIHIETTGGKKEREELEEFFKSISEKDAPGVHTRVEWTIERLKERENKN